MFVAEVKSGDTFEVEITLVEPRDYRALTKKEYYFNWKLESEHEVYKLNLKDKSKTLGLVSIERIPEEWRIHIRLLTVSTDNKGKEKLYTRITGNLLTYISKLAIIDFAELACVSMKPKGAVAQHYIDTYGMNITGATLSLELPGIIKLIQIFDNDNE